MTAITDAEFPSRVLNSKGLVMIDFWAGWCGPCLAIAPHVEKMANEFTGRMEVLKMDVDENPITPGSYGIMSIPTLLFFKDGQVVNRVIGFKTENELRREIAEFL